MTYYRYLSLGWVGRGTSDKYAGHVNTTRASPQIATKDTSCTLKTYCVCVPQNPTLVNAHHNFTHPFC